MELEIMPEQVQKILTKITDWWKKFTTKQRILLGSIVAVIILALVILAVVVREAEHGNAYRVLLHSAGG